MIPAPALMTVLAVATSDPPPLPNALSFQLMSFLSQGVTLQYEREVERRMSLALSLSHRWSGGDDFDTSENGSGLEGRFWFLGHGMIGPYAGLRFDYSLTRVSEGDRFLGSSMNFAQSLTGGARIVFVHRIEVTPSLSLGLREQFDPRGRLEPLVHFDFIRFGATAGFMF
jgi:hypothetical protein